MALRLSGAAVSSNIAQRWTLASSRLTTFVILVLVSIPQLDHLQLALSIAEV